MGLVVSVIILALLLDQLPRGYDDWLICMVSSHVRHYISGFDEIVREGDDFIRIAV